mmetsp:Transcript_42568/g.123739  ORF Transcript_42568/g.123739 Transcript_42568/m.123739 type:complete len:264 (-) Transcript_42568:518-1309(-)
MHVRKERDLFPESRGGVHVGLHPLLAGALLHRGHAGRHRAGSRHRGARRPICPRHDDLPLADVHLQRDQHLPAGPDVARGQRLRDLGLECFPRLQQLVLHLLPSNGRLRSRPRFHRHAAFVVLHPARLCAVRAARSDQAFVDSARLAAGVVEFVELLGQGLAVRDAHVGGVVVRRGHDPYGRLSRGGRLGLAHRRHAVLRSHLHDGRWHRLCGSSARGERHWCRLARPRAAQRRGGDGGDGGGRRRHRPRLDRRLRGDRAPLH